MHVPFVLDRIDPSPRRRRFFPGVSQPKASSWTPLVCWWELQLSKRSYYLTLRRSHNPIMVILPSNAPPAQTRARGRNKRPRPGRSSKNATVVIRASTQAARKWIQVKRKYGKMELKSWVAVDELTVEEKATYLPAEPVAASTDPAVAAAGTLAATIPASGVPTSIADDVPMETTTALEDPVAAAVAHMDTSTTMMMPLDMAATTAGDAAMDDPSLLSSIAAMDPLATTTTTDEFPPPT